MEIFYSENFEKKFKIFHDKEKAKKQIGYFMKDPFDERLKTHS